MVNWVSSRVSFFMSACTAVTYIFTPLTTCTTTIITLEPCALNAEFQYFIPRFIKISLLCRPLKEGIGDEAEHRVTWRITLMSPNLWQLRPWKDNLATGWCLIFKSHPSILATFSPNLSLVYLSKIHLGMC